MARKTKKLHPVTQYALDITSGKILAGKWVRLACARHLDDLDHQKEKGIRWDPDAADNIISFFPEFFVFYEGAFDGLPFNLTPHQKFTLGSIFGWKNVKDGFRRFRTVYLEEAKGQGKALALDTPIPTPTGWATMGEIQTGDQVFDETGVVCNVIAATDIMTGHDCYRITFAGGESIIADADHLWKTNRLQSGKKHGDLLRGVPKSKWVKKPKGRDVAIRTTREIAETLTARESKSIHPQAKWNHRVDVAGALVLPDISIPVPPYTLGAWLGDGDSDCARITCEDEEIIDQIKNDGFLAGHKHFKPGNKAFRQRIGIENSETCKRGHSKENGKRCLVCDRLSDHARRHGNPIPKTPISSLQEALRKNDLLNNKHIPEKYFRAGLHQRLALLQGLMDTDGYIDKKGQCEITLCNYKLSHDVADLLTTLGFKRTIGESDAKIDGRVVGKRWRIRFQAYKNERPARLKRKISKLTNPPKTRQIRSGRMIIGCDQVKSVPVRCISVDSPSRMYLAGRDMIPTHNSPCAGGVGLYGLVMDDEPGAEIYAAAVTREQAGILFRDARTFAEKSPSLREILNIDKHNIAYEAENSFFRPISSEHRGLDGKRPHIALIDEIHEHPTDIVVRKMSAGTKGRRQALIFEITNAGYDRHTICYEHHEYTEKILEGIIQDDAWFGCMTGLDVCPKCESEGKTIPQDGCPDCDDWRDERVWIKANPNLPYLGAPFRDYLRRQVEEAKSMPSQENIVKRLNFCVWTESMTKWFPSDAWNACAFPVDLEELKGRTCYAGLDLSSNTDVTALLYIFPPWVDPEEFEMQNIDGTWQYKGSPHKYQVICRFFLPEDNMGQRVKKDKIPYDVWARQGFITLTPGNLIDYAYILSQVKEDTGNFEIAELAFDRWGSQKITTDLQDIGFEVDGKKNLIQFGQGFASMASPTKEVEKMVLGKEIAHGGNPVLAWMVSNVAIKEDPAGNKKPDKEKSREKIDGAVALVMAVGRAMLKGAPVSPYDGLSAEEIRERMLL